MALNFVRGDTAPQIQLTLTDDVTGLPLDLTDAVVSLHVRAVNTTVLSFTRIATIIAPLTGVCVIVWGTTDLQVAPGNYEAEVEVYYIETGIRETIYDLLTFVVRADIA